MSVLVGDRTGDVQILDFSLAQRVPVDVHAMAASVLAPASAAYVAPEQTGRISRAVDHRADLYALGATLYHMLAGRPPFDTQDPLELVHSHIARTPRAPAAVAHSVPEQLSLIVMRLLAKAAEDRYQSAHGLRHDLDRCWREWRDTASTSTFDLGTHDFSDRLLIPQRLYGRDAELRQLTSAFEETLEGRPGLVLVGGYSGVGKTSFINELCRPIVRERGYFISGKFDQVARNVPYSALVQAFRSLVWQVLAENEERLANWRADLTAALGPNGGVIAAVIPEIEFVIGKQTAAHSSRGRRVAEPVSLRVPQLRRNVCSARASARHLSRRPAMGRRGDAGIVAPDSHRYRSAIVAGHRCVPRQRGHRRPSPLDCDRSLGNAPMLVCADSPWGHWTSRVCVQFLADSLRADQADLTGLEALIRQKTDGNPFFIIQFLQALQHDQLLSLDRARGQWTFHLDAIAAAATTDNVVTLMTQRIQRLSPNAQAVLRLAACIGNPFRWETFLTATDLTGSLAEAGLDETLTTGLIRPADGQYDAEPMRSAGRSVYGFIHDRLQQAAYALIPEQQRPAVHVGVGRQLLAECGPDVPDDRLFEIVEPSERGPCTHRECRRAFDRLRI